MAERFPNVPGAMPYLLDRDIDETFQLGLEMILHEISTRVEP